LNYESIRFDYRPNAREGELTAQLKRSPTASTDAPSAANSKEEKILALATSMDRATLPPLIKRLSDLASKPS